MSVGVRFFFLTNSFSARKLLSLCRGHILESEKSLWEYNAIFKPIFSFRENQQRGHILQPYQAQVRSRPPGITQAPRLIESPWTSQLHAKDFISDGAKENLGKRQTPNKQIRKKPYPPVREKKQPKNSRADSHEETV